MNDVDKLSGFDRDPKGITDLNPYYVAVAGGDIPAGLVLREIALAAWSQKQGQCRTQVEDQDSEWTAIEPAKWWERACLTPEQVDRAVEILIKTGIIERAKYEFDDDPGQPLLLDPDAFWRTLLTLFVTKPAMIPLAERPVGDCEEPFRPGEQPPTQADLTEVLHVIWSLQEPEHGTMGTLPRMMSRRVLWFPG